MTTLVRMTSQCTVVAAAMPEPASPPMRACDDDDGSPRHQVMRFQAIAPSRPAITITRPWCPSPGSTMPEPIVLATPSPSRAPIRLKTAAIASATRGVSAPVETDVAIAFAASWKPLV